MSTLYIHNFLTLSSSTVPQDIEIAVDITSSISTCYYPVHHLYISYGSKSAKPFFCTLSADEEIGSTGPYDDDGD